jgi:hypothetical protein|tara:strand:+ start:874 stop:1011 length:138 start_codon:yes stop_codon:yes gene_type:complete
MSKLKLFRPSKFEGPDESLPDTEGCKRDDVLFNYWGKFSLDVRED